MSKASIGDIIAAVFILALVSLMVRPSSLAPGFITSAGEGLTALVQFAVSA